MCPEQDSNLGLSMSHRLNYEAAALTTQPPQLDIGGSFKHLSVLKQESLGKGQINIYHKLYNYNSASELVVFETFRNQFEFIDRMSCLLALLLGLSVSNEFELFQSA